MKKFISILPAVILAALVMTGMDAEAAGTFNTIENGVFIGDIDVSGMTTLEAEDAVNSYVDGLKEKEITLNALNGNTVTVTAEELGIEWDNKEVVDEAGELGKAGNIVQRYKALKDLEHQNEIFPLSISFDEAAVRSVIEEKCLQYNVEAVDGTLKRENGAFVYEPGQTGVEINVDESVDVIESYLSDDWDKEAASIDLVAETTQPRGTEEELSKVKDVLGTFTTSYSTSGANRSGNVKNGCSKINGTLLYPGDSFSAYETVSLLAELDVTERFNHSMIVNYVDPSADAAISGTAKDLKFTNNLDCPVYIEGYTTSDKHITFTIYGQETRPSNRKVRYESKVISKTEPTGEKVIADGAMAAGSVSVQSAHTGYVAELWKVVTMDGEEESRTQVNKSTYAATPRTATVGTATANPAAAAAINAAIATGSIDQCRATAAAINAGTYNDPAQAAALAAQQAQQEAIRQQQEAIAAQQAAIEQAQQQAQ